MKKYIGSRVAFETFVLVDVFEAVSGNHIGTFEENSSQIPKNCTIFDKYGDFKRCFDFWQS